MGEPAGNISSVLGVVLQVGKWLADPIGRQFMYLYNYNTNFDHLQEAVNRLKDAKHRVQRKVDIAERNVEEIEGNVKKWQNDVEKTIVQAERLIQDKSNNPRCLKGLCPNLETRYKHSKKAFKSKWDDIGPLLLQEEKFDRVSYPTIPPDDKNFDKLGDDVLKLTNARRKVQRKVEEARNNEEEIEEDVKKWLEDVDSIIVKAEELIKNQSSIGTDRKTRYQNSKAASELMVEGIGPLLQQEERFHKVSYSTIQQSDNEKNFDKLRDDVLKLKNVRSKVQRKVEEAKNNVEEIEEDVKKWLEDVDSIIVKAEELIENQSSIGTDRKTRYQNSTAASELMVDNIGPLLQQEERFHKITEPPDIKKIQTTIANKLGLKLAYETDGESERASKLYSRMEKKNILLIVDNIWEELDLKKLGIPLEVDRGRNKILMTTRNVDVLEKMGSTKNFGMGILNVEEAWSLFKKMEGNNMSVNTRGRLVATEFLKQFV
ncbi:hypothetical protein Pint_21633 [Pistacia integerrima]|uniref:Uncharacterized protein n=1 Tax=Pistacia integerrima TaxID=434235 RepID=A0ACC0XD38_9ROSI|nr:hypothetical protein Pint_21633 [Pistacia integerrima]